MKHSRAHVPRGLDHQIILPQREVLQLELAAELAAVEAFPRAVLVVPPHWVLQNEETAAVV